MIQHAVAKKTGFLSWVALIRKDPHVQVNPPRKKIPTERSNNPHAAKVKIKINGFFLTKNQYGIAVRLKRDTLKGYTIFVSKNSVKNSH